MQIRPVAQGDASWPIGPKGVVKGRVVPVLPDPGSPFSTPMQTCEEVSDKLQQVRDFSIFSFSICSVVYVYKVVKLRMATIIHIL